MLSYLPFYNMLIFIAVLTKPKIAASEDKGIILIPGEGMNDTYGGLTFSNLRRRSLRDRSYQELISKYPDYEKWPRSNVVSEGDPNTNVSHRWELECYHRYQYCAGPPATDYEISGFMAVCSCDQMCPTYGDCCMGYPIPKDSYNNWTDVNPSQWSCKTIPIYGLRDLLVSIYVMAHCQDSWEDDGIRNQCEHPDPEDPFARLPVTGNRTQITYSNVFCALCNRDLEIVAWRPLAPCKISSSNLKDSAKNATKPVANCTSMEYALWYLRNVKPDYITHVFPETFNISTFHECQTGVINVNYCSEEWISHQNNSEKVVEYLTKCNAFVAPVYKHVRFGGSFKTTMYKNKFCAFCNGEHSSNLSCDPTILGYFTGFRSTSVAVLLDIDLRKGSEIVGTSEKCPPFHVYDPWINECRRIWCTPAKSSTLSNDTCVFKQESNAVSGSPETWLKETQELDIKRCPLAFRFESDEYYLRDDSSAIINVSQQTLYPKEYIILANGTLFTCFTGGETAIIEFTELQATISMWGSVVSIVALAIKIALYFLPTEEKRNLPSNIMLFLSITLLIAQFLFVVGINRTGVPEVCKLTAILMHYAFLSSFFWMNVLAYDMWKTFKTFKKAKTSLSVRQMLYYCLYGWGIPCVITVTSVTINWTAPRNASWSPGYGEKLCWISRRLALLVYFAGPIGILLAVNTVFFFLISFSICETKRETSVAHESMQKKNEVTRFLLYIKLAVIMGMTWIFGFIAAYASNSFFWYLFIVFNTLQGLFIFLAFSKFRNVIKCLTCFKCCKNRTYTGKSCEVRTSENKSSSASNKALIRLL